MATDALTQYHLGMTYVALQRIPEARETLARAVELAGDSPLPQFEDARKKLTEIGGE
jgi:cytochrome c-type biogenesis protein CcmH/NrfG